MHAIFDRRLGCRGGLVPVRPGELSLTTDTGHLAAEVEDALLAQAMDEAWADGRDERCPVSTLEDLSTLGSRGFGSHPLSREESRFILRVNERIYVHRSWLWDHVADIRLALFDYRILQAVEHCNADNVLRFGPEAQHRKEEVIDDLGSHAFRILVQELALATAVGVDHPVLAQAAAAATALRVRLGEKRAVQLLWLTDDPTDPKGKRSLAPFIDSLAPLPP